MHGAYEEMAEYGRYPKAMNYALAQVCNRWEASITHRLSARLVVSLALGEHSRRLHGDAPYIVIPCGVKDVCTNALELRNYWRERYRWQGKTVWTYCGGLSPWQWVDRVITQFAEYPNGDDAVLWLITPDAGASSAKCISAGIPPERFCCETLLPDEIGKRLPAGDLGFILREDNVTNRVAFPNKFAQYVNAGLLTVLTKGLAEPAALLKHYGVSIMLDSPLTSLADRSWRNVLADAVGKRTEQLESFHLSCHTLVRDHLTYERAIQPLVNML
jgi:hypothetical protein